MGGAVVLVAFLLPVLTEGWGGSRSFPQVAAVMEHFVPLGLIWLLLPTAAILIVLGGWRPTTPAARFGRACAVVGVAGLAALGHVAVLIALRHPEGASAAYLSDVDPTSAVGVGYWLSLLGLLAALVGGAISLLPRRSTSRQPGDGRNRPLIVGVAAGIALGAMGSSLILAMRQDTTHTTVVPLAAAGASSSGFGVDGARVDPERALHGVVAANVDGLYAGTFRGQDCRRDDLVASATSASPDRAAGWAFAVARDADAPLPPEQLGSYLSTLTPVLLRADTLVTAHRFDGDRILPYQAVLESGTPVLIDDFGLPRVSCAGAVPLAPPRRGDDEPEYPETPWGGFDPSAVVTVRPAAAPVRQFALGGDAGSLFRRPTASVGDRDVEQVGQGRLDGSFLLEAKQTECAGLSDCGRSLTHTVRITITGCPDRCRVEGSDWDGTVTLSRFGRWWMAEGSVKRDNRNLCQGTPITTSFTLSLMPTSSRVVGRIWTADEVEGTFRIHADPALCRASSQIWKFKAALT